MLLLCKGHRSKSIFSVSLLGLTFNYEIGMIDSYRGLTVLEMHNMQTFTVFTPAFP